MKDEHPCPKQDLNLQSNVCARKALHLDHAATGMAISNNGNKLDKVSCEPNWYSPPKSVPLTLPETSHHLAAYLTLQTSCETNHLSPPGPFPSTSEVTKHAVKPVEMSPFPHSLQSQTKEEHTKTPKY
jgi:hypothetical protein